LEACFLRYGKRAATTADWRKSKLCAEFWIAFQSNQVSWGELIDKITILEIKEARLTSLEAMVNVLRELASVRIVAHER
jgi:hypothetical protein